MATIEQLKEIRHHFAQNVQAAGAEIGKPNTGVLVKEAPGAGRFMTKNNNTAAMVSAANDKRTNARVQARSAKVDAEHLSETRGQSKMIRQQLDLQQQQAKSMKELHSVMTRFVEQMEADRKKLSPKQQLRAKAGEFNPYFGGPKNGGAFSTMGEALNDFLSNGLDLFGRGGRDRGGRGSRRDRNSRRDRGPRPGPGGKKGLGSKIKGGFNALKNKLPSMSMPKGAGWRGALAAAAVGGGYGLYRMFDGDDSPSIADVAHARQMANYHTANGQAPMPGQFTQQQTAHNGIVPPKAWSNDQKVYNNPLYTSNDYTGLGAISAMNESGSSGVSTISKGHGDAGGISYGKHQLSTNNGSMDAFLRSKEGAQFSGNFHGHKTGSAGFNAKYAALAASNGGALEQAQQEYTNRTHYEPQLARVSASTNVDFGKKGRAVQEMLYSTGVQYGPSSEVIVNALKGKDVAGMSDADLIKSVQTYKQQTVGAYFKSSSADVQRSVANRAAREGTQLLALNARDTDAKARGEDPMKAGAIGNIKITNGGGAQALMQGSTQQAQMANMYQVPALIGSNGVVNNDAFSSMMAGATGKFTIGADEAGEDTQSLVASGGYLVTGRKHVKLNHGRVNMQGLHPKFVQAFYIMVGDWVTNHGGDVCCVESAFRTRAEQEALWIKYGQNTKRVARPGTSRHETGFAIDIDRKSAGAMDSKGLMRKYGFHRPLSNEPWHVEMTAAARNKPIASDVQSAPQSVTPDALSASQEAEVQQQTANGVTPTGTPTPEGTVPNAGAQAGLNAANATVATVAVAGGAAIVGSAMVPKAAGADGSAPVKGATDAELDDAQKAKLNPTDAEGKPVKLDVDGKPVAGTADMAEDAAKASKAGSKGLLKGASKALPVVGTVLTVADGVSILNDDTMTKEEKQRAGSGLVGGTAGASAGAAAGAAVGSAFFGVGAIPGAIIGGGIGYLAGEYAGTEAYDAVTAPATPVTGKVDVSSQPTPLLPVQNATQTKSLMDTAMSSASIKSPSSAAPSTAAVQPEAPKVVDSAAPDLATMTVAATTAATTAVLGANGIAPPAVPDAGALPGVQALNSVVPQGGVMNAAAGLASGAAAGLTGAIAGGLLPAGWGEAIMGSYGEAQATISAASAANASSAVSNPTPATAPVVTPALASTDSPASPSYYSSDNVALQPAPSAAIATSPVTAQSMPTTPSVSSKVTHAEPVERQQHEPVKSVIALNPSKQDTIMPPRFKQPADRIPASGVSQSNSSRQTLDECPAIISDGGLVLLQTGYI